MLAAGTASYAGIANRSAPEPLLNGSAKGPCDPRLDQPNYIAGTDVSGHPVAQADLARSKLPVPDEILVSPSNQATQGKEGPMVAIDGKALEPLLNPKAACPPDKH